MAATKKTTKPKSVKPRPARKAGAALSLVPNASTFVLRTDVPVPARARAGGKSPYPFASMEINASFFIPCAVDTAKYTSEAEAAAAQKDQSRTVANRMTGATGRFAKKHPEFKFVVRTSEEDGTPGVYVGRVALETEKAAS